MKLTDDQIISKYLGLKHSDLGNGPDEYSCWNLMRAAIIDKDGFEMPIAPVGDAEACHALHQQALKIGLWAEIKEPYPGCACLLRGGAMPHVGVYLIGSDGPVILQSLEGAGVVAFSPSRTKMMGFARIRYYKIDYEKANSFNQI